MSWSFQIQGTTKEEAKAAVMGEPSVAEWKYCPLDVAEGICKALDAFSEPPSGTVLVVSSNGHVGGSSGDLATVTITYRELDGNGPGGA